MLTPSRPDIERFVSYLFRYADAGSFISLRAFDQFKRNVPAVLVEGVRVEGNLIDVVTQAEFAAERAANWDCPVVFAPPVATFNNAKQARSIDVQNGVALSVEMDAGDTEAGRKLLESVLGPCTIQVRSGGEWVDGDTGEIHAKQHLHWRLSEPTRESHEHGRLQYARAMAAKLVGGDKTAAPPAHPLRWPGSWNTKAKPRIAKITGGNEAAEIHLDYAIERLEEAIEAAGLTVDSGPRVSGAATAETPMVVSALAFVPNENVEWEEWNRIGMAVFRATSGCQEGLDGWCDWSAKSAKHEDQACIDRWSHFAGSPPSRIGPGTIFFHALANGWQRPTPEPPSDAFLDDPGYLSALDSSWRLGPDDAARIEHELEEEAHRAKSEQTDRDTKATPLPLLWFDDIKPVLDAKDFVQGLLIEEGAAVVYGESNAGKTFWATDLALHVCLGERWRNRRVEQGGVVYCVLEGGIGFQNRVSAWKAEQGLEGVKLPFAAIPSQLNLLSPDADTPRLIATIKAAAEMIGMPVKLIVIDTLSRAMAGGNENAPEDMGALVMNMDKIRAQTGACVMFIHHSGKDAAKGARGHSLLRAAIDTEIEVVADEGGVEKSATVVKQREVKKGDVFPFTLQVVELGTNRHGEAVTTCLVNSDTDQAAGAASEHRRRLPKHAKRALEVLCDLVNSAGKSGFAGIPPHAMSVPEKWWRERFYESAMPGAEPGAKQKAFRRAADELQDLHRVGMAAGRVWVADGKKPDILPDISQERPE